MPFTIARRTFIVSYVVQRSKGLCVPEITTSPSSAPAPESAAAPRSDECEAAAPLCPARRVVISACCRLLLLKHSAFDLTEWIRLALIDTQKSEQLLFRDVRWSKET